MPNDPKPQKPESPAGSSTRCRFAAQTQLAVSLRLEQTVTLAALLVALDDRADAVDAFTVGAQDV